MNNNNNNNNNNNEFIYTGLYMSVETLLQSSPVMESNKSKMKEMNTKKMETNEKLQKNKIKKL